MRAPRQPTALGALAHACYFEPLSFGVLCYTALDYCGGQLYETRCLLPGQTMLPGLVSAREHCQLSLGTWGFLLRAMMQKENPKKLGERNHLHTLSLVAHTGPSIPCAPTPRIIHMPDGKIHGQSPMRAGHVQRRALLKGARVKRRIIQHTFRKQ